MDKERKIDLLLQDICARLSYSPMCHVRYIVNNETTDGEDVWFEADDKITRVNIDFREIYTEWTEDWHDIKNVKLYLRPLKSMTEAEQQELDELVSHYLDHDARKEDEYGSDSEWRLYDVTGIKNLMGGSRFYFDDMHHIYRWLDKNMFDYRGLIPAGVAIAVTEEHNPYNKE